MVTRTTHAARLAFIAGLLVFMLALTPVALAGKGGNQAGGKPGGGSGAPSLTVSPNPVPQYSSFTGSGCGFTGPQISMNLTSPYWQAAFAAYPDANGCISFQFAVDGPGSYTLKAFQAGRKPVLLASKTFAVV